MKHSLRLASVLTRGLHLALLVGLGHACSGGAGDDRFTSRAQAPSGQPVLPSRASPGTSGASAAPETAAPEIGALDRELVGPSSGGLDSEWCQALGVIRQNCQSCHGSEPQFGAPMPLVSFEDLAKPAVSDATESVLERVLARVSDRQRPMPPGGMSAEDVAVLSAWFEAGASSGPDPTCAGLAPAPDLADPGEFAWPEDCEEFYTLTTSSRTNPSEKYRVEAGSEEHPQFIFDAPWGDDEVQVLAHRPITDNARVLHHWILYENSTGGLFGGGLGGKFLVGWAPGKEGTDTLPEGVGLYMPGGADQLRLDMHYYNLGSSQAELDASGVELCITRNPRPNTATVSGLIGSATARVGRSDNVSECTVNVSGSDAVTLLSVSPHMHKLGVNAKLELTRGGQKTVLHDGPFDFEDQRVYPLESVQVRDGDVLTTTCSYENDTGRTVTFGQDSDDEMCFNFVTYYPMGAFQCGFTL